jgi:putative membrane protein
MAIVATILTCLVAFLHFYFMLLEMVFWQKPLGRKVFGMSREDAATTAKLALNQGLYNGFLVAGLIWGTFLAPGEQQASIQGFFLSCVVVAGIVGGMSVNPRIYFVQALPGALALGAVVMAG